MVQDIIICSIGPSTQDCKDHIKGNICIYVIKCLVILGICQDVTCQLMFYQNFVLCSKMESKKSSTYVIDEDMLMCFIISHHRLHRFCINLYQATMVLLMRF